MPSALTTSGPSRIGRNKPGGEPLYATIKQFITHAIGDGSLKPGDQLPTEAQLVERFNVSRMTANRALRELHNEGTITRRAGVGSFIAEPRPAGQMIEVRNIAEEIRERGHAYSADVIRNREVRSSGSTAPLLGVETGTLLFHSLIVHREAGIPLQLEDRLVLAELAPGYGEADFTRETPYEYLTRAASIERFEHRVCAVLPDAETCRLLEMPLGSPALEMTRRTWSGGRIASFARLIHPGDRFELTASA